MTDSNDNTDDTDDTGEKAREREQVRRAKLLTDAEALVGDLIGAERVEKLRAQGDRAGVAADVVLAAWVDDFRLIEQATFHRARRDAGRAAAIGNKAERTESLRRMSEAADSLGVLRVQRDVLIGDALFDTDAGRPTAEQPNPSHDKADASNTSGDKDAAAEKVAAEKKSAARPPTKRQATKKQPARKLGK